MVKITRVRYRTKGKKANITYHDGRWVKAYGCGLAKDFKPKVM